MRTYVIDHIKFLTKIDSYKLDKIAIDITKCDILYNDEQEKLYGNLKTIISDLKKNILQILLLKKRYLIIIFYNIILKKRNYS